LALTNSLTSLSGLLTLAFSLQTQQCGKFISSRIYQKWNCRRVARAEDEAELASVGQQIGGSGNDWDEEVLNAEEEGLVFFDGNAQMHCSAITIML